MNLYSDELRAHFDAFPYPSPQDLPNVEKDGSAGSSIYTPFIKIFGCFPPENSLILDAGCGSGRKCLSLAVSNPSASVIGVDESSVSIRHANELKRTHGISNLEFKRHDLYRIQELGVKYDFINCDEVLYLSEQPARLLECLAGVLNPNGIIRINLHCVFQRQNYHRIQQFVGALGFMTGTDLAANLANVRDILNGLKTDIPLIRSTWVKSKARTDDDQVMSNAMLRGDKGFLFSDILKLLDKTKLKFGSMVNWFSWNFDDLVEPSYRFLDSNATLLENLNETQKIQFMQLLWPEKHRLLDLWCCHAELPTHGYPRSTILEGSVLQMNPAYNKPSIIARLESCILDHRMLSLSTIFESPNVGRSFVDPLLAGHILLLFKNPLCYSELEMLWVERKSQYSAKGAQYPAEGADKLKYSHRKIICALLESCIICIRN